MQALHPAALALSVSLATSVSSTGEDHWPSWRGPAGTGVASTAAPVEWSSDKNLKWVVELPGRGFSTPIVWGDRIFLTTAVPTGEEPPEEPREEGGRRGRSPMLPTEQDFKVLCLERATGDLVWEKTLATATPHEGYHRSYGSFASYSPVTDGEHLWVSFGSFGLFCLDLDGELVWKKDPGVKLQIRRQFGEGASPTIIGDTLVHMFDHEGNSFMVVLDKATGKEQWRAERDEATTWSGPLAIEADGRTQIVTSGTTAIRCYDLASGEIVWTCRGLGSNPIPNPLEHEGTIIAMSGHRDPAMLAVKFGGEGDVTEEGVRWNSPKGVPYTANPVLFEGRIYAVMDRGFISCIDATTGEPYYLEQRLPRGSQIKASPIVAGGKLYVATESGDVHVIATGDKYEVIATNSLPEQFFVSSPIVVGGELYLRSRENLFCIATTGE